MRQLLLTICFTTLTFLGVLSAQTGCPGCVVNVPASFPADTIYLPLLPDGVQGTPYDENVSFRLPKTTTPVNAIDSTTPPGLTISKFEIISVTGLPAGLYWQLNQSVFDPSTQTDGCMRLCGTPLESDSFELIVTLKATVFVLTQVSTFPMRLYIGPKVSNTDGFSLTSPTGCGSTTVTFTNNVPSDGEEGFAYTWNFGNGSPVSLEEDPAPQVYDQPGTYVVQYQAIVDTAGYTLESVTVSDVGCTEPPFFGNPDLYVVISDPQGNIVYNSSPAINNTPLPYTFPVNITLGPGNYKMEVMDDDSGIKGTDDDCGTLNFNILSNGTLVAGGLTVTLNILHPIDTIQSLDTIVVYPLPAQPTIQAPNGLSICAGLTGLVLSSSYGFGNQWWLDGEPILGATDFIYMPTQSGSYQVEYITSDGCTAISAPSMVTFFPAPNQPVWFNFNNSLRLADTSSLPAQYSLQWYQDGAPILGETGIWYCSQSSGTYSLVVTDVVSGCTSSFSASVTNNPNYNCLTSTQFTENQSFDIMPNPSMGMVWLNFPQIFGQAGVVRVWDAQGRLVKTEQIPAGTTTFTIDLSDVSRGVYAIEIRGDGFWGMGRVMRL